MVEKKGKKLAKTLHGGGGGSPELLQLLYSKY